MVGTFGMTGSLISYEAVGAPGGPNLVAKVLSDDAGKEAVERILDEARATVRRMLDDHRHVVEALRDALLERDELIGDEIDDVIGAAQDGYVRAVVAEVIDLRPEPERRSLTDPPPAAGEAASSASSPTSASAPSPPTSP
jgi:hypothetical protein